MAGAMSGARGRFVCTSGQRREGRRGVRFEIRERGPAGNGSGTRALPAFVIRYGGHVRGYVNRCVHMDLELDWLPGVFFDHEGSELVCATHGARYDPATGTCRGGPCRGGALIPLPVSERDGRVYVFQGDSDALAETIPETGGRDEHEQ